VDRSDGLAAEAVSATDAAQLPAKSWARRVLLVLSAAHVVVLVLAAQQSPTVELGVTFWALVALNALAIAGLVTRTRVGWMATLLCVLCAGVRWAGIGVEEPSGLVALLAVAFAVFCVTDPSLRREHGLAS
jgi:hypothetical protein